jgi:hypothetical protein
MCPLSEFVKALQLIQQDIRARGYYYLYTLSIRALAIPNLLLRCASVLKQKKTSADNFAALHARAPVFEVFPLGALFTSALASSSPTEQRLHRPLRCKRAATDKRHSNLHPDCRAAPSLQLFPFLSQQIHSAFSRANAGPKLNFEGSIPPPLRISERFR